MKIGESFTIKEKNKGNFYIKICDRYIEFVGSHCEYFIYEKMKVKDETELRSLLKKLYGYEPKEGKFPEYNDNDIQAAEAVVKYLKRIHEFNFSANTSFVLFRNTVRKCQNGI